MADIFFTQHAIDRFIQRHRPEMRRNDVVRLLKEQAVGATRIKEKTFRGQDQWEIQEPYCVLVTKFDDRAIICVTILPEPEARGLSEEELDLVRTSAVSNPHWDKLVRKMKIMDQVESKLTALAPQLQVDRVQQAKREAIRKTAQRTEWDAGVEIKEEQVRLKVWQSLHACLIDQEAQVQRMWGQIAQQILLRRPDPETWVSKAHMDHMETEGKKKHKALRLALNYILGAGSREDVLREIRQIEPGFLTQGFLAPHTMTKAERKAEVRIVQQVEEEEDVSDTPSLSFAGHGRSQSSS